MISARGLAPVNYGIKLFFSWATFRRFWIYPVAVLFMWLHYNNVTISQRKVGLYLSWLLNSIVIFSYFFSPRRNSALGRISAPSRSWKTCHLKSRQGHLSKEASLRSHQMHRNNWNKNWTGRNRTRSKRRNQALVSTGKNMDCFKNFEFNPWTVFVSMIKDKSSWNNL